MQNPNDERTTSVGAKIGLLTGGLLMGLVLAEGAARIIAPNQAADLLFNASDASPMNLYVIDKKTRVTTAPNLDTAIESLDYTVKITTNELGLRGPAHLLFRMCWAVFCQTPPLLHRRHHVPSSVERKTCGCLQCRE